MGDDGYYLCFVSNTSDADARKLYELRYSQQPAKVMRDARMVRAGPVPDEARQAWARRQARGDNHV